MIDFTAHEVLETITDPNFNGWFAPNGNEVGDSCDFVFQTGVPMNNDKWRIQEIWSNQAKGCVQGAGREARVLGASLRMPAPVKSFFRLFLLLLQFFEHTFPFTPKSGHYLFR